MTAGAAPRAPRPPGGNTTAPGIVAKSDLAPAAIKVVWPA
jgi:hypothetical protein